MSSGNVMQSEQERKYRVEEEGEEEQHSGVPTPMRTREAGLKPALFRENPQETESKDIGTPTGASERRIAEKMADGGGSELAFRTRLRAPLNRSVDSPGPKTFDQKYMPFAAVSDDISYFYTLDSGRVPPAVVAANPETSAEFVRNTTAASHGGRFRSLMKPIE